MNYSADSSAPRSNRFQQSKWESDSRVEKRQAPVHNEASEEDNGIFSEPVFTVQTRSRSRPDAKQKDDKILVDD